MSKHKNIKLRIQNTGVTRSKYRTQKVLTQNTMSHIGFRIKCIIVLYVVLPLKHNLTAPALAASCQNQQSDCAPSDDSDQPRHPPSPSRVFAVRMKKASVISYPLSAQRRLWSDWADWLLYTIDWTSLLLFLTVKPLRHSTIMGRWLY